MEWPKRNVRERSTFHFIARRNVMNGCMLTCRFRGLTGKSPPRWLQTAYTTQTARARRAQQWPETTALSAAEQIATEAGFGSANALRERFGRIVGATPRRNREAFTTQAAS
ncbi:hypothetical protein WS73_11135 [Burkholderia savannae]|nr:hypothetical protein WS91_02150 [Burkholderia sp. MSMB1498]KWZ49353.1 hypothetical protein WS73_11135 [Burkholderia savannae]